MAQDKDKTANGVWRAPPSRLARLLALGEASRRAWSREELRAVLADQMEAPLPCDLAMFSEGAARKLRTLASAQRLLLRSCGDLLRHAHPPVELLRLVKEFGKSNLGHQDSHLPEPIARVLYYASVAAARLKLNQRLSELEDPELARGLRWALEQDWLDATTRSLFQDTLALLAGETPPK